MTSSRIARRLAPLGASLLALLAPASALVAPSRTPVALVAPSRTSVVAQSAPPGSEECVALGLETKEEMYAQWGVCVEQATGTTSGGLRFNPQDEFKYAVEELEENVVLTRNPGLGIELLEVANNGEGVGIVVVDGTVDGTSAAASALRPGDVLAAVGPPGGPFAPVEATTWDGTVDALGSVEGDRVELVVKRLVKRPVTWITVKHPNGEKPDERHRVYAGENLRRALLTRKVALNDPLARRFDDNMVGGDCGSGGACCTCAVAVMNGGDLLSEQKASERQIMKTLRQPRFRLACKTSVGADLKNNEEGELTILVNPRQQEA
mmetsp:Transcript_9563/g.29785  ORF Transcript_9563/g.29785 Transcript_9563/m.29785 type:complete len:322 (+) Transcript_9563:245-1210(+)